MSSLAASLSDYLVLRRALGCKLITAEALLRQFVAHCDARGLTVITSEVAVAWAMLPAGCSTAWWEVRLGAVRPFTRWLQALEPATEVPALDAFGRVRGRRATPYIYSDDDVDALMQAASRLQRRLSQITYATLIGLLAATGMRSGEAIRLSRDDIDWKAGSLRVLNSKFNQLRLLVLHRSTTAALEAYARKPGPFVPSAPGSQLPDQHGRPGADPLRRDGHLPRALGVGWITAERDGARPRLHYLRHTFAMKTLRDRHAAGIDVEGRLPLLSTYMGHANPKDTYWYLSASPDLLGAAAARLSAQSRGASV